MKDYVHPDLNEVPLAAAMQALADPCRMSIVRALLKHGAREVAGHEIPLRVNKATRSHHFETLRAAGLIHTRVEGTKCLSTLRRREFDKRFPGLLKLVMAEGDH